MRSDGRNTVVTLNRQRTSEAGGLLGGAGPSAAGAGEDGEGGAARGGVVLLKSRLNTLLPSKS